MLMVAQSRIYTQGRELEAGSAKVQVFNTRDGKLLYTIKLPRGPSSALTNGRELFLCFGKYMVPTFLRDEVPPIRAYRLPEY